MEVLRGSFFRKTPGQTEKISLWILRKGCLEVLIPIKVLVLNSNRTFVAELSDRKTLTSLTKLHGENVYYAVGNFLFQLIFLFSSLQIHYHTLLYPKTKEKQKLTEIKNELQHIYVKLRLKIFNLC